MSKLVTSPVNMRISSENKEMMSLCQNAMKWKVCQHQTPMINIKIDSRKVAAIRFSGYSITG